MKVRGGVARSVAIPTKSINSSEQFDIMLFSHALLISLSRLNKTMRLVYVFYSFW